MYAIVTIAGQQFKVIEGQEIFVHRLEAELGSNLSFDQIHLIGRAGAISVGTPVVASALVKATVISHDKGDKVIVFKKKRRKGYRKKNGHRQSFTRLTIDAIVG